MSWWYGRSVAPEISLPEGIPLALFAAVEGAEMTDRVRPVLPPTHPGQLQPLPHHRLARALHRPAADAPTLRQVLRVLHPMRVPLQITDQVGDGSLEAGTTRPVRFAEHRRQQRPAFVLQELTPLAGLRLLPGMQQAGQIGEL